MTEIKKYDGAAFRRERTAADADVSEIIRAVAERGDAAVREYTLKFDGCAPESFLVTPGEISAAVGRVGEYFMQTLREAAANITAFHCEQLRKGFEIKPREGVVLGQKVTALRSVGLYVPGGTAAYPSTVLMNAIPAKIAGVENLIMTTPPGKNGEIKDEVLAAAFVAGVDRVYKMGGAQAIAALAYGTETVPRTDKIVGPGNRFVASAKRAVFGLVDIDMIAGPSEILIVADALADPKCVAADLLSQAEHDTLASAVLVTDSEALAEAVQKELERQLSTLPREAIARKSMDTRGGIFLCADIAEAVDTANDIAPEHIELCVEDPDALLPLVRNAGSVFLGRYTPEALGDYFAGTNHTLPTSGTARFSSPLGVDSFIKRTSYIKYTKEALERESDRVADFARREGLEAHARSVESRTGERK